MGPGSLVQYYVVAQALLTGRSTIHSQEMTHRLLHSLLHQTYISSGEDDPNASDGPLKTLPPGFRLIHTDHIGSRDATAPASKRTTLHNVDLIPYNGYGNSYPD